MKQPMKQRSKRIGEEFARELHARAVLGESVEELAYQAGYKSTLSLTNYWGSLGLPGVRQARRLASAQAEARKVLTKAAKSRPAPVNRRQRAWLSLYEEVTTFEPMHKDELFSGTMTFDEVAQANIDWFEQWSKDSLLEISSEVPSGS